MLVIFKLHMVPWSIRLDNAIEEAPELDLELTVKNTERI